MWVGIEIFHWQILLLNAVDHIIYYYAYALKSSIKLHVFNFRLLIIIGDIHN